jgi:hypothetical protein
MTLPSCENSRLLSAQPAHPLSPRETVPHFSPRRGEVGRGVSYGMGGQPVHLPAGPTFASRVEMGASCPLSSRFAPLQLPGQRARLRDSSELRQNKGRKRLTSAAGIVIILGRSAKFKPGGTTTNGQEASRSHANAEGHGKAKGKSRKEGQEGQVSPGDVDAGPSTCVHVSG